MFRGKKLIAFDMDGTLIDSMGLWNEVDRILIKELGGDDTISEADIQERRDSNLGKYNKSENPYTEYSRILKEEYNSPLSPVEISQMRRQISEDFLINKVEYKPDVDKFLKLLKQNNFLVGIATNSSKRCINIYRTQNQNIINVANIDDNFDFIYTKEDVKNTKPDPEVYRKICEDFNVTAEECLAIEDSLIGIETANNGGVDCVALYDKYADKEREEIIKQSKYQVSSFSELIEILQNEMN